MANESLQMEVAMTMRKSLVAVIAALLLAGPAPADVVRMKDGRTFIGVILEEKSRSITIDTKISNIRSTVTLHRREIASIEKKPLPDGFFDDGGGSAQPETPAPSNRTPERSDQRPSPRRQAPVDIRYLEIPIAGVFGEDIIPIGVENALEQARRRNVEHIVFRIDSDGGYVWAAEDIAEILEQHEDEFTYHALIDKAISAAIWVALSCDTMHMTPGATMGAAVVYSLDETSGDAEVDAKFNSAIAARLAARAEKHGHSPVLVRAMVLGEAEAYAWKDESGEWVIGAERPKLQQVDSLRTLDKRDTVLTLTAKEADELGFATLFTEKDAEALREGLGVERWRGSGNMGANEMERARSKAKPVFERFGMLYTELFASIERAVSADPGNFTYYVDYGGNLTGSSRRDWQRYTDQAITEWRRVHSVLVEMERLERDRAELRMSRWVETVDLQSVADQVADNVRRLEENRDRR